MCNGAKETMWLRRLAIGLQVVPEMDKTTEMYFDNQTAIALAHNFSVNLRNKHIEVRFHFTRQVIEDGSLKLQYCPTEKMSADMFTKALGRVKLSYFTRSIGMDVCRSADAK